MPSFIWLVIAAVMALVEAVTFGLITLWFVLGALAAFAASLLGASSVVQVVVFLAVSVLCLVLLRPLVLRNRARGEREEPTPVGQRGIVVEDVDNAALTGRVELADHMTWAARSSDDAPLPTGTRIRVIGQESIKLVVEPASD